MYNYQEISFKPRQTAILIDIFYPTVAHRNRADQTATAFLTA